MIVISGHFVYRNNDTKTRQSLSRVLSIWQDRGVYDKYLIKKTRHVLDNPIAESSSIGKIVLMMVTCGLHCFEDRFSYVDHISDRDKAHCF